MDPEQQAMLQALRGQYGQGGGFKPTQGMQFQGFQPPQHAPLAGPSLGGGQGGQGGGGGGAGGGMGEIAKSLGGILQQAKPSGRPPTAGAAPVAAPASQAGPPIVATQAEMGPFQPLPSGNAGTPQVQPQPLPPPRPAGPAPYNAPQPGYGGPMTGPQSDRALPPTPQVAMTPQMQAQMPQLMRAGGELPDWLFRMPRMTGAMGI